MNQIGLYIRALGSLGVWLAISKARLQLTMFAIVVAAVGTSALSAGLTVWGAGSTAAVLLFSVVGGATAAITLLAAGPLLNHLGAALLQHRSPLRMLVERYVDEVSWSIPHKPLYVTVAQEQDVFDPDRPSWRWRGLVPRAGARPAWVPKYTNVTHSLPKETQSSILRSSAMPFVIDAGSPSTIHRQVDAGVADNLPIKPLIDEGCGLIIAVHLNDSGKDSRWKLTDEVQLKDRTEHIHRLQTLAQFGPDDTLARFRAEVGDPTIYEYYLSRIKKKGRGPILESRYEWNPPKIVHIVPSQSLGNFFTGTLNFSRRKASRLIDLGYKDALATIRAQLAPDSTGRPIG